jgi:Zn-dependent alcohol dehydrogenase
MVSKTLTIAEVNTAFDLMESGEVIRSVLRTTGLSANAKS